MKTFFKNHYFEHFLLGISFCILLFPKLLNDGVAVFWSFIIVCFLSLLFFAFIEFLTMLLQKQIRLLFNNPMKLKQKNTNKFDPNDIFSSVYGTAFTTLFLIYWDKKTYWILALVLFLIAILMRLFNIQKYFIK